LRKEEQKKAKKLIDTQRKATEKMMQNFQQQIADLKAQLESKK
jgi:hypothetical protein